MNDRAGFLGGSDVAAVLGVSPWQSPFALWCEKVGLTTRDHDDDHEERLNVGKDAEHFLAAVFQRHHPHLYLGGAQADISNPDHPILRGHVDGFVLETPDGDISDAIAGWEAKTDRAWKPWTDVPVHYQCQAQTYMLLTGLPQWWFTVGFSGWTVAHYIVAADPTDQALIVERCRVFWDHVLNGEPPEVTGHPADTVAIRHAWPTAPDQTIEADDTLAATVHELDAVKRHIRANEKRATSLENIVKARLRDEATDVTIDGTLALSWRPSVRRGLDQKAVRAAYGAAYDTETAVRTLRLHLPETDHQKEHT